MKALIVPILLLLAFPMPLQAQMVEGKIFSTPEQREYLDYRRKDFLEKNKQKKFNFEEA